MTKNGRKRNGKKVIYRYKKKGKSRKSKNKKPSSAGSKIYSVVKNASGYLAFASQLTAKDYSDLNGQASYKNEDIATKAKIFANIVTGRLTGIHAFKGDNLYGSDDIPFTVNPSGVANKFTGLGIAGLIYKNIPIKSLPMKSKVGAVAKRVLVGGILGGVFDPPMNSPSKTMASSPKVLGVRQQNRMATMQTGMYSESADSTGGSF